MNAETIDTLPERIGWDDMYLVEEQETPFPRSDPLHYFLSVVGSFTGDSNHRVCGDDDTCWACELIISFVSALIELAYHLFARLGECTDLPF
jgi:hypothetical protein